MTSEFRARNIEVVVGFGALASASAGMVDRARQ